MSVSTLAGTTWIINSNPLTNTVWSHCGTYNINYHFGGISYGSTVATATTLAINGMGPPPQEEPAPFLLTLTGSCSAINGEDNISPADYVSTMETAYGSSGGMIGIDGDGVYHSTNLYYYDDTGAAPWVGDWTLSNRTIEIIDGTDVTNANLIAWLEANAEQQIVDVDYLTTTSEITSIANAIRTKGGTSASLVYPTGFVTAIQSLPSGAPTQTKSVSYTSNNTYTVTPDTGYALSQVNVTVNIPVWDGSGTIS